MHIINKYSIKMFRNRVYIYLVFFSLWTSDLYAHQDRIYSFKAEGVNVEIHTGFLFYLESDKAKILSEMISDLRTNLKIKELIKVNYVHNYIGFVDAQVVISDSIVKVANEYTEDMFKDEDDYDVSIVVVANQLPIKEVLNKLYSILVNSQKWKYKNYQFNTKYGEYKCIAISNIECVSDLVVDSMFCGRSYLPSVNISMDDKYYFEFTDFDFRIIKNFNKRSVVAETDSIYQLNYQGLNNNAFIFESQMAFRFLSSQRGVKGMNHPKIYLHDAIDHFREFEVISIGREVFILKYKIWGDDRFDYTDGTQVYYDALNKVYLHNFESVMYKILCE